MCILQRRLEDQLGRARPLRQHSARRARADLQGDGEGYSERDPGE